MDKKKDKIDGTTGLINKILYFGLRVITIILLVLSIVFTIISDNTEQKSRFAFIAINAAVFLVFSVIPSLLEKRLKFEIPTIMELLYIVMCASAWLLGEICEFYVNISVWDDILHTISGCLLAILGYSACRILNNTDKTGIVLTPLFTAFFVVCFAMFFAVIWEVVEFCVDTFVSTSNMQRTIDSMSNIPLEGKKAVVDTMGDLIEGLCGALLISILGYYSQKRDKGAFDKWTIARNKDNREKYDSYNEEEY